MSSPPPLKFSHIDSKVKDPKEELQMTFLGHLEELRQRVIKSFIVVFASSALSLIFVKKIVKILELPAGSIHFLQLAPGEFLFISIKVAGYTGLTISLPFILYQILRFVLPGLTPSEKRLIAPSVAGSAILFLLGIFFSWKVLIPAALSFLISYGADVVDPLWSIEKYLDFVILLIIATGLAFQLPILQLILGSFGIISWKKMVSGWRWVIVISSIAGAVLTPSTDPITMILLSSSITILFFIGIGLVALTSNRQEEIHPIVHPSSKGK